GPLLIQFPRACPSSEDYARSIRRQSEIGQAALSVGEHSAARTEHVCEVGGQRLSRDDVARGSDYTGLQEWVRIPAVAVGRQEHGAGRDAASLCHHDMLGISPRYAKDGCVRSEIGATVAREVTQSSVVLCRMQSPVVRDEQAPVETLAADLLLQLFARD